MKSGTYEFQTDDLGMFPFRSFRPNIRQPFSILFYQKTAYITSIFMISGAKGTKNAKRPLFLPLITGTINDGSQ